MLLKYIHQLPEFRELVDQLLSGKTSGQTALRLGIRRAARLPLLAALQANLGRPILFITDRNTRLLNQIEELRILAPQMKYYHFAEPAPLFYEASEWDELTRLNRLQTLGALTAHHLPSLRPLKDDTGLFFTSIRAVMTRTLPRRDFIKNTYLLRKGQKIQPDQLVRQWIMLSYEPVTTVTSAGQFARRGGLLDVWPMTEEHPIRLDFFGDEIDTLRAFDPATQRSVGTREFTTITPAREYLVQDQSYPLADNQTLSEYYIPLLHPTSTCILNYLPPQAIIILDDLETIKDVMDEVEQQAIHSRQEAIQRHDLPENFPLPYITRDEILELIDHHQNLTMGVMNEDQDTPSVGNRFIAAPRFGGKIKPLLEYIEESAHRGDHITLVTRQEERLKELWEDADLAEKRSTSIIFQRGSLAEGWILEPGATLETPRLQLLTDGEIFGWQPPQARRRARPIAENPEMIYADLNPGDWVVHIDYGIGLFQGLVERSIEGVSNEYLCIEYAQGDQLFVPVVQSDKVTRYIGADAHPPALQRLGSQEWQSVKTRAREGAEEVARELLELYAQRKIISGYAFSSDTHWQQELEASFPYIETEDQMHVLRDVKKDMENPQPMDRLICGDVGYGKTEIALRAAFKAVMDGKQVAMVVPTTVLAQQHFQTFRERLAPFPVQVDMLSRFRTPQEQKDIVARLAVGGVDLIIGTHRLFSADIQFKDLGLLIIDEEQRFGVTHKDALKKMRTEVDVLTLTATPIPRTLYMALTGLRDISTLNTPPAERLPVITHVGNYSPRLIRQAVLREMERGGQVFFVHNRVHSIDGMRRHLETLIPEAHISVAHGQMPEELLSKRMREFATPQDEDERVDVLLSTTIIESGLDIPNANTLIVDQADRFGLAQLYQLRGRIGRGAQRGYAYFFRHKKVTPTPEGRLRLETIGEYTQLGSGYSIAMRDLEIRGAGELLGTQQHGHIAAVGFHLYTRLLSEAVRRMRKEKGLPNIPAAPGSQPALMREEGLSVTSVDLPLSVSIPQSYIIDRHIRLGIYRRMAEVNSLDQITSLQEELTDRFGMFPEAIDNLFFQLKVKIISQKANILSINAENNMLAIRFPSLATGITQREFPAFEKDIRVGRNSLWFEYKKHEDWKPRLLEILDRLI